MWRNIHFDSMSIGLGINVNRMTMDNGIVHQPASELEEVVATLDLMEYYNFLETMHFPGLQITLGLIVHSLPMTIGFMNIMEQGCIIQFQNFVAIKLYSNSQL